MYIDKSIIAPLLLLSGLCILLILSFIFRLMFDLFHHIKTQEKKKVYIKVETKTTQKYLVFN